LSNTIHLASRTFAATRPARRIAQSGPAAGACKRPHTRHAQSTAKPWQGALLQSSVVPAQGLRKVYIACIQLRLLSGQAHCSERGPVASTCKHYTSSHAQSRLPRARRTAQLTGLTAEPATTRPAHAQSQLLSGEAHCSASGLCPAAPVSTTHPCTSTVALVAMRRTCQPAAKIIMIESNLNLLPRHAHDVMPSQESTDSNAQETSDRTGQYMRYH
jgi:hypothetical protein